MGHLNDGGKAVRVKNDIPEMNENFFKSLSLSSSTGAADP